MPNLLTRFFFRTQGSAKQKKDAPKDEGEKKGAVEQVTSLKRMAIDVQKILDFIAGLLEKGFHTFIWIRPQATFTLCIALGLSTFLSLKSKNIILIQFHAFYTTFQ